MTRAAASSKASRLVLAELPPSGRGWLRFLSAHQFWVLSALAAVYLLTFTGRWRIADDSREYVHWARLMFTSQHEVASRVRDHFYPGLPWLIAQCFEWFGDDSLFVPLLLVLASALTGLAMVYVLGRRFGGHAVGLVAVVMVGVNHLYFAHAYRLLTDMYFALSVFVLLVGAELTVLTRLDTKEPFNWRRELTGWMLMAVGAAVMVQFRRAGWLVLAIVVAVGAVRLVARRRWASVLALVMLGIGAAGLFGWLDPREATLVPATRYGSELVPWTQSATMTAMNALTEVIPQFIDEVAVFVAFGVEFGDGLDWVFGPAAFVAAMALWRQRPLWAALVAGYTLVCLTKGVNPRYFLPLLPILAIGWWSAAVWLMHVWRGGPRQGWFLCMAMLVLWLVPSGVRNVGLVMEQWRTPFFAHHRDGLYAGLPELGRWTRAHTAPGAILWTPTHYRIDHMLDRTTAGQTEALQTLATQSEKPLAWLAARHAPAQTEAAAEATELALPAEPNHDWRIAGLGDLNGDGVHELIWRNTRDGRNRIWQVQSDGSINARSLERVADLNWRLIGAADWFGDGHDDLLWRNRQTGSLLLWDMHAYQKQRTTKPPDSASPDWRVIRFARFDDDALPDLHWHHPGTGQSLVRMLGRHVKRQAQSMPRPSSRGWTLVGWHAFGEARSTLMLWRHNHTHQRRAWLIAEGQLVGELPIVSQPAGWTIAAVGHLTDTRRPQLVWRHAESGKLRLAALQPPPIYVVAEGAWKTATHSHHEVTHIERSQAQPPLHVYQLGDPRKGRSEKVAKISHWPIHPER